MSQLPLVSVVVLNWNGCHLLETCLDTLLDQTYTNVESIVVDNASTDNSISFLEKRYGDRLNLIILPENLGYAEGNNVGLKAARGDFLVTLNNDTRVHPEWIQHLVKAVQTDSRIGICASHQVRFGDPETIDAVGVGLHPNGESWNFGGGQKDQGQFDRPMEVFSAHGASAFYRRKTLEEAGFFDKDFFAYHEEFDLCWRIQLLGWRCLYVPEAILEHQGGATVRRKPGLRDYLSSRNRLFCILKNFPSGVLPQVMPALLKCELWNIYLGLVKRESFRLKARIDAFSMAQSMLTKRREIQAQRKMTDDEFRSWLGVSMKTPIGPM